MIMFADLNSRVLN